MQDYLPETLDGEQSVDLAEPSPSDPTTESIRSRPVSRNGMTIHKLRAIPLELLNSVELAPVPVYGQSSAEGVISLLLPKGSRVNKTLRDRIDTEYGGIVYVQAKDYSAYVTEMDDSVSTILADETKEIQEKTPVFFSYATDRLNEAFRRISDEGGDDVSLVVPVAEQALDLIHQDWKAAFSILKLAKTNPETYAHSLNVTFFGLSYVHNFLPNYSDADLKEIALGFLSHDIGELVIAEDVRNKETGLTAMQRRVINQIPLYGEKVLKDAGCDYPLTVEIVMNHHERMDGTGYPRGLSKSRIPILARVCAICEVFDVMTTPQSYREEALLPVEAFRSMLHDCPGQFDMEVLGKFIRMMGGNPRGNAPHDK